MQTMQKWVNEREGSEIDRGGKRVISHLPHVYETLLKLYDVLNLKKLNYQLKSH